MTFTLSQIFMGALTIGMASFHGTEAYLGFHHETQLGNANYAASKLGADHARSANASANNNVISGSIMGPRFAVEADNITMDADALIACPQTHNAHMQTICAEYHANKWRALAKLIWVRAKQQLIWSALGKLTETMHRIASLRAIEEVTSTLGQGANAPSLQVFDPSRSGEIWGADNTSTTCTLSQKDALLSNMPGSAFPILMENLLQGLPKALVELLPQVICGAGGNTGRIKLPQIPSVADKTNRDCSSLAEQMAAVLDTTTGVPTASTGGPTGPSFSSDVSKYVTCAATSLAPGGSAGGYAPVAGGPAGSCSFDWDRCQNDKLEDNSADFLKSVGLPDMPSASSLGGSTLAPTDSNWNHADSMRACASSSAQIDPTMANISEAMRQIVSFGSAPSSSALRSQYEYEACAKWYFPDGGESEFASVPHEQQPFVAAWKYALVAQRQ
jgi:hypothetical protein